MGRFRQILYLEGLVSRAWVEKLTLKHGLLYFDGTKIVMVKEAPPRQGVDFARKAALLANLRNPGRLLPLLESVKCLTSAPCRPRKAENES